MSRSCHNVRVRGDGLEKVEELRKGKLFLARGPGPFREDPLRSQNTGNLPFRYLLPGLIPTSGTSSRPIIKEIRSEPPIFRTPTPSRTDWEESGGKRNKNKGRSFRVGVGGARATRGRRKAFS